MTFAVKVARERRVRSSHRTPFRIAQINVLQKFNGIATFCCIKGRFEGSIPGATNLGDVLKFLHVPVVAGMEGNYRSYGSVAWA